MTSPEPVALVVPDEAIRGTLAARLSMAGEAVLTACDWHDPVMQHLARRDATLVIDAELVGDGEGESLSTVGECWPNAIVVLSATAASVRVCGKVAVAPPDAACILEALAALHHPVGSKA